MSLFRLFYVSTASPEFRADNVEALVAAAAEANARLGITGALQFTGVNFGQALEGEREAVMALFERIKADRRHDGVVLISSGPVQERRFPDWAMKQVSGVDFAGFAASMMD